MQALVCSNSEPNLYQNLSIKINKTLEREKKHISQVLALRILGVSPDFGNLTS